jgi:LSD1 subclass zinc finger protein
MAQADLQPAGPGEATIRTFPCGGCGAKLSFAPGTSTLKCEFCGKQNAIAENDERIEELDFDTYLKALEGKHETHEAEAVQCTKCGAKQTLPENIFAGACGFCGASIVSKGYAHRLIKPKAIVPFQVDKRRAQDEFRRWVKGLWLAPGDLKRYAQSDAGLAGTYIPFWTYDCRTASDYDGERGDDYYTNETVTSRNASGEEVTETRRVKQTRWTATSGHVEKFHDDVLVMASSSLPRELFGAASNWNLKGLVPYQEEFVSGFRAEAYQLGLREGFPVAKETIDLQVRDLVRADIGGDAQRIHGVATNYSDIRFKHVLLPVWVSAYRYRDKAYRFLINGQTGEVCGESPTSWQKVTLIVFAIVLVAFIVLVLAGRHR